jgi:hypothetical protein
MQNSEHAEARKIKAKHGNNRMKALGLITLGLGVAALVLSILYVSSILAFIGLGLVFWGVIFPYIQTEEYVKEVLLDATVMPLLVTLNQTIQELDYESKAVYLPPKYLTDPEDNKAYLPRQKEEKLPTPEQVLEQETALSGARTRSFQGILITPPGAELTRLFEKTIGTSFTRTDLNYLRQNLPKLVVEGLEIAADIDIQESNDPETKRDMITVRIKSSIFNDICRRSKQLSHVYTALGCPLSSAIACVLAKATGRPLIIEKQETSEDGQQIEVDYRILEEPEER